MLLDEIGLALPLLATLVAALDYVDGFQGLLAGAVEIVETAVTLLGINNLPAGIVTVDKQTFIMLL